MPFTSAVTTGQSVLANGAMPHLACAVVALGPSGDVVAHSGTAEELLGASGAGGWPTVASGSWLDLALAHIRSCPNGCAGMRFSVMRGAEQIDVFVAPWQASDGAALGTVLTFELPAPGRNVQAALQGMAANLAHEIRNPLGSIRATVQMFGADCPAATAVCRQSLDVIRDETDRINALIRDLIAFSSPLAASRERLDVNGLLASVAADMRERPSGDGVAVLLDLAPADCYINGDERALRECLARLCENAFAAMSAGGQLSLRARAGGGKVVVEVEDTGEGIGPDSIQHVFDPFFSTRVNGVGLGLALVRAIVEQHSGLISISSARGHGTRCTMEFPVREGGQ